MRFLNWFRFPLGAIQAPYRSLGFEVYDSRKDDLSEVIGDVAIPVGHTLMVWHAGTGLALEFELTAIEAKKGEVPVARFIARRTPRPDTAHSRFRA